MGFTAYMSKVNKVEITNADFQSLADAINEMKEELSGNEQVTFLDSTNLYLIKCCEREMLVELQSIREGQILKNLQRY